VPVESGIDESRGGVDEQTETTKRTLAFNSCNEVVGDGNALGAPLREPVAGE
jgi:hypothetical protein